MSGLHCENYDVKRETVHCYPRNVDCSYTWSEVARCCHLNLSAFFKICFCFVWLYNKSLDDWSLGEQWILFPENLYVSRDEVEGNIEIRGKQNSLLTLFPRISHYTVARWEGWVWYSWIALIDGKVGWNTDEYTMAFLHSDWPCFQWHGIKRSIKNCITG